MSTNGSAKLDGLLVIGFGAGLYYFYKGFRTFREYQVLMDTPEIPIRSVAMGLVEIHGQATGVPPVPSPVTQTPCLFYKVDIDHWVRDKNGGHWSHVATDTDGPRFYLADSSGKVLVDAHKAEYDLLQNATIETDRSDGFGPGSFLSDMEGSSESSLSAAPEPDLWSYASRVVSQHKGAGIFGGGTGMGARYRLSEYLVVPEHWYDITGTCVENPEPQNENDHNLIVKGTNEPTFLITWRSEKEIRRTLRNRAVKYIFSGAILSVACLALFLAKHGAF